MGPRLWLAQLRDTPRRIQFDPGRDRTIQARHAHLRQSVDVFRDSLAETIEKVFRAHARYRDFQSFKVFTEFFGPGSFAGLHKEEDPKELRLFDVWIDSIGMIGLEQFEVDFGHLHSARVIYRGKLTGKFAEDVRMGKYGVNEGVVCKGGTIGEGVWMVKIKTYSYMERLKQAFADRWEEFWE